MANNLGGYTEYIIIDGQQRITTVSLLLCTISNYLMSFPCEGVMINTKKITAAYLTDEYAAVPKEMKLVAKYFGKEVLRDISINDVLDNITDLRKKFGDRCVLRALHFIYENKRVQKEIF